MERLDKDVGVRVKGRGVMSGLLSFLYPSPDIYTCLEVYWESSGFPGDQKQ